jgi:hypothetical protein
MSDREAHTQTSRKEKDDEVLDPLRYAQDDMPMPASKATWNAGTYRSKSTAAASSASKPTASIGSAAGNAQRQQRRLSGSGLFTEPAGIISFEDFAKEAQKLEPLRKAAPARRDRDVVRKSVPTLVTTPATPTTKHISLSRTSASSTSTSAGLGSSGSRALSPSPRGSTSAQDLGDSIDEDDDGGFVPLQTEYHVQVNWCVQGCLCACILTTVVRRSTAPTRATGKRAPMLNACDLVDEMAAVSKQDAGDLDRFGVPSDEAQYAMRWRARADQPPPTLAAALGFKPSSARVRDDEYYRYHGATSEAVTLPERPMSPAIESTRSQSPKPAPARAAPAPAVAGNAYDESFVGDGDAEAGARATFSVGSLPVIVPPGSDAAAAAASAKRALVDSLTAALIACRALDGAAVHAVAEKVIANVAKQQQQQQQQASATSATNTATTTSTSTTTTTTSTTTTTTTTSTTTSSASESTEAGRLVSAMSAATAATSSAADNAAMAEMREALDWNARFQVRLWCLLLVCCDVR